MKLPFHFDNCFFGSLELKSTVDVSLAVVYMIPFLYYMLTVFPNVSIMPEEYLQINLFNLALCDIVKNGLPRFNSFRSLLLMLAAQNLYNLWFQLVSCIYYTILCAFL